MPRVNDDDFEYLFSYGTLQYENVQIETFGRKLDFKTPCQVIA